jgi:hypothetical protein
MKITNGSKKRCREKFPYKGINKIIETACEIIEFDPEVAIAEFIYDPDDNQMYNVMLFLLKENYNKKELDKFDYIL